MITVTGNVGKIAGAEALQRFAEYRLRFEGLNDGDAIGNLNALTRFGSSAGYGTMFRIISGITPTYRIVDTRRVMRVASSGAANSNIAFRPLLNAPFPIDFRETLGGVTGQLTAIPSFGFATSIMAWVRKIAAGDATHARTTFGFGDNQTLSPSASPSRLGMIGDGGLGYRFGSVNCPDGNLAGENVANAIDANFVAPAELINPGTNWWHVRIKMIPPTATTPGRWGAYLNGRLVATFLTLANFPRGSGSLATGNHQFTQVEAAIYAFFDAGVIPGLNYADVRVWLEEDYSL